MSIFDELEDETPASLGEEVGEALSAAVADIGKSNEKLAVMLAKAITDAINAVESKEVLVQKSSVKKWSFIVERDKDKLMTKITATAE